MSQSQVSAVPRKLWEHPNPRSTQMWQFIQDVNEKSNRDIKVRTLPHDSKAWA